MSISTYWLDVADRAARTACQAAVAAVGTEAIGLDAIDWQGVVSVSAGAALVSVLMSIGLRGFGRDTSTASLVPTIGEVPRR